MSALSNSPAGCCQNAVGPTISVVVASCNNVATVERCIGSVFSQTYPFKELVVIDGGSTDGTVEILRSNDKGITYWESEPDRGIYHAWNKGLDRAKGDWIYFLGADDRFAGPDVLGRVAEALRQCPPSIRLAYGMVALAARTGEVVEILGQPWSKARVSLKNELSIPPLGVFLHRSLFRIHGKFDESFRIAGDYEFLLRELTKNPPQFMFDVVVSIWSLGGASSRPENGPLLRLEDARARKLNGLPAYSAKWLWELFKSSVYRILYRIVGPGLARHVRNMYRRYSGKQPLP
ncbi:MAG: glycosyltransferase [Desulfomonile tiedjei]|nr:glycosyltransferase [Desulfomonile tiedjei]